MATKVSFEFEPWNNKTDVPLDRPGSSLGYAVVNGGLPVGQTPTQRERRRDALIGPALQGVVGLLAGSLEWLRQYGYTPAQVEAAVNAYLAENRGSRDQVVLKAAQMAIEDIADGANIRHRLDKNKIIPVG